VRSTSIALELVLAEHFDQQQAQGTGVRPVKIGGQSHTVVRHGQRVGSAFPCRKDGDFAADGSGTGLPFREGVLDCVGYQLGYK
jgi:hypothetical protein